jgi:hypothetical protein
MVKAIGAPTKACVPAKLLCHCLSEPEVNFRVACADAEMEQGFQNLPWLLYLLYEFFFF